MNFTVFVKFLIYRKTMEVFVAMIFKHCATIGLSVLIKSVFTYVCFFQLWGASISYQNLK